MIFVLSLAFALHVAAQTVPPPPPPVWPDSFAINLTSSVFQLNQRDAPAILYYAFRPVPTASHPSAQRIDNSLCPTGDTKSPCTYLFIDKGNTQAFWVMNIQKRFCCLALDVGPVIPTFLKSWSFFGQFSIEGTFCNSYYSLDGGPNNLNTFSCSADARQRPVLLTRAGPGAFNATLVWKFSESGFQIHPQARSLFDVPSFCKGAC
jgi:hypothetical protein